MQIKNKVAVVTGANRGIGAALVDALLDAGVAKVYATARRPDTLPRWAANPRVVALPLDVTDASSRARAAEVASDVALLVNNAGTLQSFDVLAGDDEALRADFETNTYGLLATTRAFLPALERAATVGDAAIVNLLTLVSVASMPGIGGYSASKAAAWSLTLAMRAQLTGRGIAVHGVYPGAVDTDMLRGFEMPKTPPSDVAAAVVRGVEAGEEDIAPDPMSAELWTLFLRDPKAVERRFAAM